MDLHFFISASLLLALIVVVVMTTLIAVYFTAKTIYERIVGVQTHRMTVEEMYGILDVIIATEIVIYEKYLGNTTDTPLTNAQFINIYNDLSKRILKGISNTFYRMASYYLTREELQTYITQRVYNYLAEKVAGELDDEEPEVQDLSSPTSSASGGQ